MLPRLGALVVLEDLCAFLEPGDVRRLAAACAWLRRLVVSGVGVELIARQALRHALLDAKRRLVDRVHASFRELPAPGDADQASLARQLRAERTALAALREQLAAHGAELEELRDARRRERQRAQVLAHEVLRLRESLAAAQAAADANHQHLTEIARLCAPGVLPQ